MLLKELYSIANTNKWLSQHPIYRVEDLYSYDISDMGVVESVSLKGETTNVVCFSK